MRPVEVKSRVLRGLTLALVLGGTDRAPMELSAQTGAAPQLAAERPRTDAADAEVFVLTQGGRIRGRWLNRGKRPLDAYEIALETGGALALEAWQVQLTISPDPGLEEYERIAAASEDTVAGQWAVAEWCRQRQWSELRRRHLERILQLDPDHAGARRALGYSRVRGRWITRQESLESRGYRLSRGRWQLPQQIQLDDEQRRAEEAQRAWWAQLRRWRQMLSTPAAGEAYRSLATVKDPAAVLALRNFLRGEPYRQLKMLYIEALGRIDNPAAASVLVETSLNDPDEEIFHACLTQLVRMRPPHVSQPYIEALKDNNNVKLNRAAYALGQVGEDSCISPLVDALISTHTMVIPGSSDVYTATFVPAGSADSPRGGSGLSSGREPVVIPWTARNERVLQALIQLSGGVNFDFDQRAWHYWLANENRGRLAEQPSRREGD